MATEIIGHTVAQASSETDFVVAIPDGWEEGDLLFAMIGIGFPDGVLAVPAGWYETDSLAAGDVDVRCAFTYATASEPAAYTFVNPGTTTCVIVLFCIRGAARSYDFDPVDYPLGYFAPGGGEHADVTDTSTTLTTQEGATKPSTALAYTRVFYGLAQHGTPSFDDIDPLITIHAKTTIDGLTFMVCEEQITEPTTQVDLRTVRSSGAATWAVIARVVEPYDSSALVLDNYKAKMIRGLMPPPYDTRLTAELGKLMAVIGTSDNAIGGLPSGTDFLPNEDFDV